MDPVRTNRLDAWFANLSLDHQPSTGFSFGGTLPIGTIRVEPTGANPRTVNGFGDLQLHLSYDFNRIWGRRGRRPSLRVRPVVSLPSGQSSRVVEGDAPPNLVSIGSGAFGVGGSAQLLQPIYDRWAARLSARWQKPLSYNNDDLLFGTSSEAGLAVVHRPISSLLVTLGVAGVHRSRTQERTAGDVLNSGGRWLFADFVVGWAASDRMAVGGTVRAPLYRNVEGEQIVQSIGLTAFLSLSFGGAEKDEHDHGKKDEHDHEANIRDLATGGKTFSLAKAAVPGKIVVIDFWATWCKPCKHIEALLHDYARRHPKLAVRKVEVPSFTVEVAKEHLPNARGLPIVWILDEKGQVVAKLEVVKPEALESRLRLLLGDH